MKKKAKQPTKKLSKRARRKELTGINLEASKRRDRMLDTRITILEIDIVQIWRRLKKLEARK